MGSRFCRFLFVFCLIPACAAIGAAAPAGSSGASAPTGASGPTLSEGTSGASGVSGGSGATVANGSSGGTGSTGAGGGSGAESSPTPGTRATVVEAATAFYLTAAIVTLLLGGLLRFMLSGLGKAQNNSQWSFGDALSEESTYQPKEIRQKSDVITFASTSRLIALVGLMGILSIVVGIGYTIIWNLYVNARVPDLSDVRTFLYGCACLFAPYLANQLSGIFTPSAKTQAGSPSSALITGVSPGSPTAAAGARALHVTGSGFQTGLSLALTDPAGVASTVSGAAITSAAPTLVAANVTLNAPGSWKVAVANPSAAPSDAFTFSVFGPPTITNSNPAPPVPRAATPQQLTFTGSGFMSGLTVNLTPPGGANAIAVPPVSVTATSVVVSAVVSAAPLYQVVITNPGDHASPPFRI